MCMSLVIFDRRHLVLRARALTAAVGGRFLPTVRNCCSNSCQCGLLENPRLSARHAGRANYRKPNSWPERYARFLAVGHLSGSQNSAQVLKASRRPSVQKLEGAIAAGARLPAVDPHHGTLHGLFGDDLHQPVVTYGGAAGAFSLLRRATKKGLDHLEPPCRFIPFDNLPTGHLVDCAEYAPFGFFGELAQERSLTFVGLGNR